MDSEWKNIIEYSSYSCSNHGNIRNDETGRILNPKPNIAGYVCMRLKNNMGTKKNIRVHRIIAQTWIDNPTNLLTVNHKNKIRHDNRIDNLEWMSYSDQNKHRSKFKKQKRTNNNKGVWQCNKNTNEKIKYFETIKNASENVTENKNGFKNISSCARGKTKSAYGFKWVYNNISYDPNNKHEKWKLYQTRKNNNYFISNLGRIRNNMRILKPNIHRSGYRTITINKTCIIHRIVAKLFVDNPNNYNVVNHIDGNKLNNNSNNLEWCTTKHNVMKAIKIGLRKNVKKVIHYNAKGCIMGVYNSCADASRKLNVNPSSINKCCKGNLKTCGKNKYMFKYLSTTDDIQHNKIDQSTVPTKAKKTRRKYMVRKIKVHDKNGKLLEICNNKTEASKKYNVNTKTIDGHCDKIVKYPTSKYIFTYA